MSSLSVFALLALLVSNIVAVPMGTAISYSGKLQESGQPANGSYDLKFALFDAPTNGVQFGLTLTNAAVTVSNGQFGVLLDFGAEAFNGDPRWLEIGVRTNGATAFVTLDPRQRITPIPYALYAMTPLVTGSNGIVTGNSLILGSGGSSWDIVNTNGDLMIGYGDPWWFLALQVVGVVQCFVDFHAKGGHFDGNITATKSIDCNTLSTSNGIATSGSLALGNSPGSAWWSVNTRDYAYGGQNYSDVLQFSDSASGTTRVAVTQDGNVIANKFTGDGSGLTNLMGNAIPQVQVFDSSGTFVVPANVTRIIVELWGGGGGGGSGWLFEGQDPEFGCGGGGGGYGRQVCNVTPGASYPVTVGLGGGSENDGGTSSFGALVQATGGQAGCGGECNCNAAGGTSTAIVSREGENVKVYETPIFRNGGDSGFGGRGGRWDAPHPPMTYLSSVAPGGGGGAGYGASPGNPGAHGRVIVYY